MSVIRPIDRWFAQEILPHEPRFRSAARRLCGSREEAEDMVQDAFARLLALEGWAAIINPHGYVLRMLRHIAIERIRRQRIVDFRQLTDVDHFEIPDNTPGPECIAISRDALRRVGEALSALPERCRVAFLRRRVEGESPKAIAEDLGISLSTFEKRLARAIELLARADLADQCVLDAQTAPRKEIAREAEHNG